MGALCCTEAAGANVVPNSGGGAASTKADLVKESMPAGREAAKKQALFGDATGSSSGKRAVRRN